MKDLHICFKDGCGAQTLNPKYCSRSCAASANAPYRLKSVNSVTLALIGNEKCVEMICEYSLCSKSFYRTASKYAKSKNSFCSSSCSAKQASLAKIESWKAGSWDGCVISGLSTTIRNYLLEQANYTCQSPNCCVPGGWSVKNPVTDRVPLEVDHIDGDCYNNTEGNLIVLCPNCHSITPTYGALNKNGKRQYRRDRYAAGKSF